MRTDIDILKDWALTYGDSEQDVKHSLYGKDLMIDFAKYYHQQVKNNDSIADLENEKPPFVCANCNDKFNKLNEFKLCRDCGNAFALLD